MIRRPLKGEYLPYFDRYLKLVPDGDISEILNRSHGQVLELFSNVTEKQAKYRYAPGKWSLKEVLGHIADNERIMSYRLLRIARGDQTPLAGYDQDVLMSGASFDRISMSDVLAEYSLLRRATLALLRGLPEEAWSRKAVVGEGESTALAWACIMAGHELHHLRVIREKYMV